LFYFPLQLPSLERSLGADLVESDLGAFEQAADFDKSFMGFLVLSGEFLIQGSRKRNELNGAMPLWRRNPMGQRQRDGRNGRTQYLRRS